VPEIREVDNSTFDFLLYTSKYKKIKKYFELMKFDGKLDLIQHVIHCLNFKLNLSKKSIMTYIPSTYKNRLQKGYDFSEEVAKQVAERFEIPLYELLQNKLILKESKNLDKHERAKLAKQKLKFVETQIPDIDIIYVFDDVITTGSTMQKACQILRDKFPDVSIVAICLAKTNAQICYEKECES